MIARRFAAEGRRAWAWFYGAAIPMVFAALTVVGLAIGGNPSGLAFLATPWVGVTAWPYTCTDVRQSDVMTVRRPRRRRVHR